MEILYPLYVIRIGGGFASLVEPGAAAPDGRQHLVVLESEQAAAHFMFEYEIQGEPAPLKNAREFCWLLQALRNPVTEVAFDPEPTSDALNARWSVAVRELLDKHLKIDLSPWNYPVYVITQQDGFVSIQGQASDGRPLTAVAVFTSKERATGYLDEANEDGELCALKTMDETKRFLNRLQIEVFAVALDPRVEENRVMAEHCFDIATLLEKYLKEAKQRETGDETGQSNESH